jgi:CRISPR/Cas system-associated exonuclease Cas4 (RecB family)
MINRPHWSYSSINQYLRCPLQFYFQRILRLPQPTVGVGLVLGSSVHAALELYHRSLQKRKSVKIDQLHRAFLDAWQAREKNSDVEYRKRESRDDCIAQGIGLVEIYLKEPPPEDIVSVEQQMIFPIHNSRGEILETPMVAIVDLLTRDDDGLAITELKTSGRAYGGLEVETSMQPTSYVNAVWETFGELARVGYAVLVKTKTPKVQRLATVRNESDFGRLGDLVQGVERAIEVKAFYPNETPLNCSTCPYRQPCQEWGTERPDSAVDSRTVPATAEVPAC